MHKKWFYLLMYGLGGTSLLTQCHAFGADNSSPRLLLVDALSSYAAAERIAPSQSEPVFTSPSLQLQMTTEPQDFPDDDEDIPDLTRSVLPERERRGGEPPEISTEKNPKKTNPGKNLFGMTLAPIRWGGYTQDLLRYTQNTQQNPTLDHSQQLDLHADSYIWQPWFALVSGNVGIGRGVQESSSNGDTKVNSLTGSGTLQVFPQSRFPFTASFSASDSTTNSSLSDNGTRAERYSFRQQYRPKKGNAVFSATYDNSTIQNQYSGDDNVVNWRGTYGNQIGFHGLSVELNRTESEREQGREGLLLDSINVTHSYNPKPGLSITTAAHASDSEQRQFHDLVSLEVDTTKSRYMQASTSANWRPKEDIPLNFSGGINFFNADSQVNGDQSESQSLNGNLGVSYFFNPTPRLSISLGGSVMALTATSDEMDQRTIYLTENGTANYAGEPLTLGNFSYNWNLNSSVIHQTLKSNLTESSSTYSLTAGGSHNLNRVFRLSEISTVNLAANQSLTTHWTGQAEQNSSLSTSTNLSWQVTPSNASSASIHLSATDTHRFGGEVTDSQYLTLQGNGRIQLTGYSNLTATASFQWNRQGALNTAANAEALVSTYTSANLAYQNSRAFKINNLSYTAQGTWSMQNSGSGGDQGGAAADTSLIGYSLDQRLQYRLGRIDMGAAATYTYQDGKENALLWLHVGRTFGNY